MKLWILATLVLLLAACQGSTSGDSNSAGRAKFTCAAVGAVGQDCASASASSLQPTLAPFPGAMLIDGGDATIGEDNWFTYSVSRPEATPETQGFTVALMMPALCIGASLPSSGWQWLTVGDAQFSSGGTVYESYIGINCPDMALGTTELWALLGEGDVNGTTYPTWVNAGTLHPPPDDSTVLPHVVHSAVISFNAVTP